MQSRSRYLPSPVLVVAFLIVSAGLSSAAVAGGLSGAKQHRPSRQRERQQPTRRREGREGRAGPGASRDRRGRRAGRARNAGAPGAAGAPGCARAARVAGRDRHRGLDARAHEDDGAGRPFLRIGRLRRSGLSGWDGCDRRQLGFDSGIVFVSGIGDAAATKWTIGLDNFGFTYTANVDVFAHCAPNVTVEMAAKTATPVSHEELREARLAEDRAEWKRVDDGSSGAGNPKQESRRPLSG